MSFLPRAMAPASHMPSFHPIPISRTLFSRNVHVSSIRLRPGTTSSSSALSSSTRTGTASVNNTSTAVRSGDGKKTSPHLVWYREIVPAMVPIILLSSTIFLSLTLLRTHLSHNLSLCESSARIAELESQLDRMRRNQRRAADRERKERERILPLVVERVLQRVGAMAEEDEGEESGDRLLV